MTADGLLGWLGSERVRSGLNGKQLELLRVVVERVLVELELVPPDHEIALRRFCTARRALGSLTS